MLDRLPDLSAPLSELPGVAWRAYGVNGVAIVVPTRLGLETGPDGRPVLLLTLLRKGGAVATVGGRLELGLALDGDLAACGNALAAAGIAARVALSNVDGGVLSIGTPVSAVAPVALAPPLELSAGHLTRVRIVLDLTAEAAVLAARLVEDQRLPVEARLRLRYRAVAPRLPLVLTFEPREVTRLLAKRFAPSAPADPEEVATALDALLNAPEVTVVGNPETIDPTTRRQTIFLRLREFLARDSAAGLVLHTPETVGSQPVRVDLAAATAVTVEMELTLDPLAAARVFSGGTLDGFVRRIEPPPLPIGRTRIAVEANLPEPVAGLEALFADIRVPPAAPFRPFPLLASVRLDAPDRHGEAELRLAPGEKFAGEARLRAVLTQTTDASELTGSWRPTTRALTLLGPADFPAPFVVIRASAALRAAALIEVLLSDGARVARLDADAVSVPRLGSELRVRLTPVDGGRTIEAVIGSERRVDLDMATLPGFGVHRARVRARLDAHDPPLLFEWRGDEEVEPLGLTLTAERPDAEFGWLAASPFRPGVRWRSFRAGQPGPWSEPILPEEELLIEMARGLP